MRIIAVFLLSVALFSAADSAPTSNEGASQEKPGTSPPLHTSVNPDPHLAVKKAEEAKVPTKQEPTTVQPVHQPTGTEAPSVKPAQAILPPAHADPPPVNTTTTTITSSPTTNATTPVTPTTLSTKPSQPTTPTVSPPTTTSTTQKPSTTEKPTTVKPTPKPSPPVTTVSPPPVTTPPPKPAERHFDGPSFIGGAVLVLGLGAISGVLYMFYKARTDRNYRTL